MIVYWDIVIILTTIVNYCFIKTISLIYHIKISLINIIVSLFWANLSLILFVIPCSFIYHLRYFFGIVICFFLFLNNKKLEIREKIIATCLFYTLNLTFIGVLVTFNIKTWFMLLISLIYTVVLLMIDKVKIKKLNIITVNFLNQKMKLFIDTGNLAFYQMKPIIFINKIYLQKEINSFKLIGQQEVTTINTSSILDVYEGPPLYINNYLYDCVYCFCVINDYDLIGNGDMNA